MNRRGLLGAMLASGVAPAVVRAGSLMKIYVPAAGIVIPELPIEIASTATVGWFLNDYSPGQVVRDYGSRAAA